MRTFWCSPKTMNNSSSAGSSETGGEDDDLKIKVASPKLVAGTSLHRSQQRLVDWIVTMMIDDIKKIVSDCVCYLRCYYLPPCSKFLHILLIDFGLDLGSYTHVMLTGKSVEVSSRPHLSPQPMEVLAWMRLRK